MRAGRRHDASGWWVVGIAVAVGLVHVLVVSHRYFVGSFDDDANYILTGRSLLAGQVLTGHLASGDAIVAGYPPGYPALLVPLLWLFPHSFVPLRLLSAGCSAAIFPLTCYYLGRLHFPDAVRIATLALMAFNPVLATYGSMVMPETPFLCCLLSLLIALERWEATPRLLTRSGVAVVVLGAALVWLKEAGIGMTLGVIVWLVLRRQRARAAAVAGGLVVMLLPVLVARRLDHIPLGGARYAEQFGTTYGSGLASRFAHVIPGGVLTYLGTALPRSIVEFGSPLPETGLWYAAIRVLWMQVTVLTIVGLIVTVRRHRHAVLAVVAVYIGETLLYPYVNERRVVLVLPLVLAWYASGVRAVALWLLDRYRVRRSSPRLPATTMAALGVLLVALPLAVQFPRDYLFGVGQDTSRPQGSRYVAVLKGLGGPADVVETDYKYTAALFSGHRTADNAFLAEIAADSCSLPVATASLAADRAGFLLLGALNKYRLIDNACLYSLATTQPWAVRILRTDRDQASVWELVGPGTAHPALRDQLAGAVVSASGGAGVAHFPVGAAGDGDHPGTAVTAPTQGGTATLTWSLAGPRAVTQVSVGEAGLTAGTAHGVDLRVQEDDGRWVSVAAAPGAVGDGSGHAPFLLATLPTGTRLRAVRIVVRGSGQAIALDVSALGPRTPAT